MTTELRDRTIARALWLPPIAVFVVMVAWSIRATILVDSVEPAMKHTDQWARESVGLP